MNKNPTNVHSQRRIPDPLRPCPTFVSQADDRLLRMYTNSTNVYRSKENQISYLRGRGSLPHTLIPTVSEVSRSDPAM